MRDAINIEKAKTYAGNWQSISSLEKLFNDVWDYPKVSDEDKRLKQGPHGLTFKFFIEEVYPLIKWLKATEEYDEARVIDGNQPYDAEVRNSSTMLIVKVEIGVAIDGYQNRLGSEFLTENGRASGFSKYERDGKGKSKTVLEVRRVSSSSSQQEVSKYTTNICNILKSKSKNSNYTRDMILVIGVSDTVPINEVLLGAFKRNCVDAITSLNWSVGRVDVIGYKIGLLASVNVN